MPCCLRLGSVGFLWVFLLGFLTFLIVHCFCLVDFRVLKIIFDFLLFVFVIRFWRLLFLRIRIRFVVLVTAFFLFFVLVFYFYFLILILIVRFPYFFDRLLFPNLCFFLGSIYILLLAINFLTLDAYFLIIFHHVFQINLKITYLMFDFQFPFPN